MTESMLAVKTQLLAQIAALLEAEQAVLLHSVASAEEAATHAEAKPENKYDTRGLEASYLAGAQRERLADLQGSLAKLKATAPRVFGPHDPISTTALVDYDHEDERATCFLSPVGAGFELELDGQRVVTVTTQSPLGRALLGKRTGDLVAVHVGDVERDYEILAVR